MVRNEKVSLMETKDNPALLIIDMVKDYLDPRRNLKITPFARAIVDPIKRLSSAFRENGWPVIFSTDAYKEDDFIFTGRMEPESLAGTEGAEVIDELETTFFGLFSDRPGEISAGEGGYPVRGSGSNHALLRADNCHRCYLSRFQERYSRRLFRCPFRESTQ
jgi:hypothetical protein